MKSGDNVSIPDVLIQAHSASMGMIIYGGDQFPSDYSGRQSIANWACTEDEWCCHPRCAHIRGVVF